MRSLSDSTEQPGHSRVQRLGKCVDGCDPATLWRGFRIVLHRARRPVANTTILELDPWIIVVGIFESVPGLGRRLIYQWLPGGMSWIWGEAENGFWTTVGPRESKNVRIAGS
jgi:hypothetical protein